MTDDVELLVDFTDDKKKLKDGLKSLLNRVDKGAGPTGRPRFGRSQQYSALMATLKEAFANEDLWPIVIFQTDGDEVTLLRDPKIIPAVPSNLPNDLRLLRGDVSRLGGNALSESKQNSVSTIFTKRWRIRGLLSTSSCGVSNAWDFAYRTDSTIKSSLGT